MSDPIIVLDVSNLAYRNYHGMKKAAFQYPVIHGMLRDLEVLSGIMMSTRFIFCFDTESLWRKSLLPEYKGTRLKSEDDDKIKSQIRRLPDILAQIGYQNIFQVKGYEADDLIASICCDPLSEEDFVIVSNDKDLYQLICERVTLWNPIIKETITKELMMRRFELLPTQWAMLKAITGCKTDGIPGVPRIGTIGATNYILGRVSHESKSYQTIHKSWDLIQRNLRLVSLPAKDLPIPVLEIVEDEISQSRWNDVVNSLGMNSLANKYPRG